jgi:hypothetical protein
MTDHNSSSRPARTTRPVVRDLRFAGTVAAGLCAGVLGVGAIAAPLVGWNDWPDSLSSSKDGPALTVDNRPVQTTASREARSRSEAKAPIGVVGPVAAPGSVLITTAGGVLGTSSTPSASAGEPSRSADTGSSHARLDGSSGSGKAKVVAGGTPGFAKPADSDQDGMSDLYEKTNGLDPYVNDSGVDTDNDGVPNGFEYQLRTAANNADTNADGTDDGRDDFDDDGVANAEEVSQGSSPLDRADTPPAPEGPVTDPAPEAPPATTDEPEVPVDSGQPAAVETPAPSDPATPPEESQTPVDPAPPADPAPADDPQAPVEPADQSTGDDDKKKDPDQTPVASPDDHHATKPDPVAVDDTKNTQPVPTEPPDGDGHAAATAAPATTPAPPPADPPVQATPPAPTPAPVTPAPAPVVQTAPPAVAPGSEQTPPVQP